MGTIGPKGSPRHREAEVCPSSDSQGGGLQASRSLSLGSVCSNSWGHSAPTWLPPRAAERCSEKTHTRPFINLDREGEDYNQGEFSLWHTRAPVN